MEMISRLTLYKAARQQDYSSENVGKGKSTDTAQLSVSEPSVSEPEKVRRGEFLVEMDGVKVQYGDQVALGGWKCSIDGNLKEGLYWSVRRGDRWGIFGPNGKPVWNAEHQPYA